MTDESPFRDRGPITTERALELLQDGDVELLGRMPWSSNATFLVDVCHQGELVQGVYKPGAGERPLWDFPDGLYRREEAAFALGEALGWGLVPPTVVRDGPHGEGSVQLFIPTDFDEHYFTLVEDPDHHHCLYPFDRATTPGHHLESRPCVRHRHWGGSLLQERRRTALHGLDHQDHDRDTSPGIPRPGHEGHRFA